MGDLETPQEDGLSPAAKRIADQLGLGDRVFEDKNTADDYLLACIATGAFLKGKRLYVLERVREIMEREHNSQGELAQQPMFNKALITVYAWVDAIKDIMGRF